MGDRKNWLLNFLGAVLILVGIVVLSINESKFNFLQKLIYLIYLVSLSLPKLIFLNI